jgi:DNA polymerase-1
MSKKVVILDGYNAIHRCRFNWGGGSAMDMGEYQMVYNFIQLINATAKDFSPDVFYFAIDGRPTARLEIFPDYKANRKKKDLTDEEIAYWDSFKRQKRIIVELCKEAIPVTTVYHPDEEADDVAYKLCKQHPNDEVVVITNDSDYIQIVNELDNVKVFNPIKRVYFEKTEYDYVSWKSMVGDPSDNIPGVRRVGKKTADKILKNGMLQERLSDGLFKEQYDFAYSLIKMRDCFDMNDVEITEPVFDHDRLVKIFDEYGFRSFDDGKVLTEIEDNFVF